MQKIKLLRAILMKSIMEMQRLKTKYIVRNKRNLLSYLDNLIIKTNKSKQGVITIQMQLLKTSTQNPNFNLQGQIKKYLKVNKHKIIITSR